MTLTVFTSNLWDMVQQERDDETLTDDEMADALAEIVAILRGERDE